MKRIKLKLIIGLIFSSIMLIGESKPIKIELFNQGGAHITAAYFEISPNIIMLSDSMGITTLEANIGDKILVRHQEYQDKHILIGPSNYYTVQLNLKATSLNENLSIQNDMIEDLSMHEIAPSKGASGAKLAHIPSSNFCGVGTTNHIKYTRPHYYVDQNTESYTKPSENGFKSATKSPLSTLSIDVDAASYSNVRRYLKNGSLPPADAVRVEEMINYFDYNYPEPNSMHPFEVYTETGICPWNKNNKLLHIGIQGEKLETKNLPSSNLVFLIDVSGSMSAPNKLPLLKKSFKLLTKQLRKKDKVAMVVYAGSSGLVLNPTNGDQKETIISAFDKLHAGGSTAGAAGLELAYKVALENFIDGGNNRIILATDGDFNVGPKSNQEMENIIEEHRKKGIFISVLGFGMGNYKDDKMEIIADKGNGNYAYIDNILEAKKVLVHEFGGTLFTIAEDVKIQIEFNPLHVKEYRLIGYENRLLNAEDFNDDTKDAGELGSGHTVTAIYEIVPADNSDHNALRYQEKKTQADLNHELAMVKFRYKKPESAKSTFIEHPISTKFLANNELSEIFKFSTSVAGFGMILSKSKYVNGYQLADVLKWAKESKGNDPNGYRSEFIELVKLSEALN